MPSPILSVMREPWAIKPDKLELINAVVNRHFSGEKIDISAFAGNNTTAQKNYEVLNGVAIIPIFGVIARRANLFSDISGGASAEIFMRDLQTAVNDRSVQSILLHIDSAGGTVQGTEQAMQAVIAAKAVKKVVALADGCMCSAAYWIASAASEIFIADETTMTGSIGVICQHIDQSAADTQAGLKVTSIYAGKYKNTGTPNAALSSEDLSVLQADIDALYSVFVDSVAKNRGVTSAQAQEKMADARVFIGSAGITAGLIDGKKSLNEIIDYLQPNQAIKPTPKGKNSMTKEELMAAHGGLIQEMIAEAALAATSAETARVLGIQAITPQGMGTLAEKLKADGKTSPAEAAMQFLTAQKQNLSNIQANLHADAPDIVPDNPPANTGAKPKPTGAKLAARAADLVAEAAAKGKKLSNIDAINQAHKELTA